MRMVYSDIEIDSVSLDGYYEDSVHSPPDIERNEAQLRHVAKYLATIAPPSARVLDVGWPPAPARSPEARRV